MKENFFYVGISDTSSVRRNILEASKSFIQILQRYESLKAVRSEKYAQAAKLKTIYDRIIALLSDIKAELPNIDIKSLPKYEERPVEKKKASLQEEKPIIKRAVTGIERLEAELNDIEEKLKAL